jgi:DNA-binding NarL/FixJ family response regulator
VLIGLRASAFRDQMDGWIRGQGFDTFVTGAGRQAVDWLRRTPGSISFLDRDLERVDGEEVWRVVRPTGVVPDARRLVLMAEVRTKELWMTAVCGGVAAVLPLPADRDAVLCALRLAVRT